VGGTGAEGTASELGTDGAGCGDGGCKGEVVGAGSGVAAVGMLGSAGAVGVLDEGGGELLCNSFVHVVHAVGVEEGIADRSRPVPPDVGDEVALVLRDNGVFGSVSRAFEGGSGARRRAGSVAGGGWRAW